MTAEPQNTTPSAPEYRVYQTPPALGPEISAEEHGATQGKALSYAKRISTQAAIIAGVIGGAISGAVLIASHQANRTLKIVTSGVGGGIAGFIISNLPWHSKPIQQSPADSADTALPSLPSIPSPAPTPHPASPAPSIEHTAHDGRVEGTAPEIAVGA